MKKNISLTVAALAAGLFGAAVSAAPITIQYTGFVDGLSRSGTITGSNVMGGAASVAAGQFNFNVINDAEGVYWDETLQAFCIDTGHALVTSGQVTYDLLGAEESGSIDAGRLSLIHQLYDNAYDSLGTAQSNAAFQLALWDILNENWGMPNLSSGSFYSSSFGSGGNSAQLLANSWLSGLHGDTYYTSSRFEFFVLEALRPENNQELLVVREVSVPEPGPLGLLGASLIAVGAVRRWRSRK